MAEPIDAMPTKELFIDMLTRDIGLAPSIIDLADNSADAAKKLRGAEPLKGLHVRLTIKPDQFRIEDNCGGMTIDAARHYAFRFGRVRGAPSVKHSVGQFGVGMKRAIFKMGRAFRVESKTTTSQFVVEVDVDEWAEQKEWQFAFSSLDDKTTRPFEETGTVLVVSKLKQDAAEMFKLQNFENKLRGELQSRLQEPIAAGLVVSVNGIPATASPVTMLASEYVVPAYKEISHKVKGTPVAIRLYCGLGRSRAKSEERVQAGWHVYCNGRLILEADKSDVTGWGEEVEGDAIPGFHGQYNQMRGLAYFDSDDPSLLPWNTTKTGINTDPPVYRAAKLEMMAMMRPVINFLNDLKKEKTEAHDEEEKGPLARAVEEASPTPLPAVAAAKVFAVSPMPPSVPKTPVVAMQKIQYEQPAAKVAAVKKALGANTLKEVGEKTFNYFYDAEVEE